MVAFKHGILKKIISLAIFIVFALSICIFPQQAHAGTTPERAVLSKGISGIIRKGGGSYYIEDEYGNKIEIGYRSAEDLDKYVGKTVLFAEKYVSGSKKVPFDKLKFKENSKNPKKVKPPIQPPICQPMYGIVPPPVTIVPIEPVVPKEPPKEVVDPIRRPEPLPMYGAYEVYPKDCHKKKKIKEVTPPPVCIALYAVYPVEPVIFKLPHKKIKLSKEVLGKQAVIKEQVKLSKELKDNGITLKREMAGENKKLAKDNK
jgi:hypothetical protein